MKASEKCLFKKHLYCKFREYYLKNQSYQKTHRTQTRAYFVLLGLLTAYAEITEDPTLCKLKNQDFEKNLLQIYIE